MAGALCTYLDNKLLNKIFNATAYTFPTTLYVGLSTTTIAHDGTNITEPTDATYLRVAVVCNTTNFPLSTLESISNGTAITFPTFTTVQAAVTDCFIADDTMANGGNILAAGTLTNPKTIDVGDTPSFDVGEVVVTLN